MWTGRFDPDSGVIWLEVVIHGPRGARPAGFLLDTGAFRTSIDVNITDELGYGAHLGRHNIRTIGAGAPIPGYVLPVQRLEVMGLVLEDFDIICEDIEPEAGIDGLIGMDVIRGHVLTIDAIEGTVTLTP